MVGGQEVVGDGLVQQCQAEGGGLFLAWAAIPREVVPPTPQFRGPVGEFDRSPLWSRSWPHDLRRESCWVRPSASQTFRRQCLHPSQGTCSSHVQEHPGRRLAQGPPCAGWLQVASRHRPVARDPVLRSPWWRQGVVTEVPQVSLQRVPVCYGGLQEMVDCTEVLSGAGVVQQQLPPDYQVLMAQPAVPGAVVPPFRQQGGPLD
mmetsp:Transcript_13396/g.32367  ORF Transcript_13396/g.32367 Transcript_13396/m.32367 type:complete len:204 (+) Transcript_13396:971-1582(+)